MVSKVMSSNRRKKFSARLEKVGAPIVDDAPNTLRIGYIKLVLPTYVGEGHSGRGMRAEPLAAYEVHELFLARCRTDAEPHEWGEASSWDALCSHLKSCSWAHFFDFVELIAELLLDKDDNIPFDSDTGFDVYHLRVNELLDEETIGWRMDGKGELRRNIPTMNKVASSAEAALDGRFKVAREHYRRALSSLLAHPVDEANGVREAVSALESVAKVIVPRSATLGAAVKELRKDACFNRRALDIVERLYTYSNETALVRHGQVDGVPPTRAEAEMVVHAALAMICYIIEVDRVANARG